MSLCRLGILIFGLDDSHQDHELTLILWFGYFFTPAATISLVIMLGVAAQHLSPQTSKFRNSLRIIAGMYLLWWSVIAVALLVLSKIEVSPKQLINTALTFRDSQTFFGPQVGLIFFASLIITLVITFRGTYPSGRGDESSALGVRSDRRIIHLLATTAPGLFLFSRIAIDVVTRQHVERVVFDRRGNVSSLIGPLLPSFLWSAITAIALGVAIFLTLWTILSAATTNTWTWPSFRMSFTWVLSLAFIVRLGTLLLVAPTRTDGGDPLFYHTTANLLATGHGFPEPLNFIAYQDWTASALHGPLYPVVLSLSSRLGGTTYFDHKFFSILIGTAIVAVVGLVARRVAPVEHKNPIALLAMLAAAIYPNLWLVDGVMFPEGLMALCTTGVVYGAYRWRDTWSWRWAAAMGALVGLAALTRGEGLLLAVLLIVPWIPFHRHLTLRRRLKQIVVAALACIMVLAPWFVRNLASFEKMVPLSTNGNELFVYANCDEAYSGKFIGFWLFDCQEQMRREGIDATGDEAEKSLFWREKGFDYAKDHLSELPRVIAARVGRQWELFRPWQNSEFAPIEGRNKDAARVGLFMYYGLAIASVYGAVLLRRRRVGLLPLGALFVNVTLTAVYAYGTTRFRVPAEPALCILGAVGAYPLLNRVRQRYQNIDPPPNVDPSCTSPTHETFVHGGDIHIRNIFARSTRSTWAGIALIASAITIALPALYRSIGSSMEEGFMLVFPERIMKGAVANVDFLHLYGPGSLHVLSLWMRAFGTNLTSERTFGLLQHLLVVAGLVVLTRPWGKKLSTLVGLFSLVFVFTPIGLQALAWSGGVGIALWSVIFIIRGHHQYLHALSSRRTWVIAGALAGLSLTFRPDLIAALALVVIWVLRRKSRLILGNFVGGLALGLTSIWIHMFQAGPTAFFRGVVLDPVIHLRPGRELPRPPSWHYLQGALQVISEKFAPWWGIPSLSAPRQLFLWFFMLPIVAIFIAVVARRVRRTEIDQRNAKRSTTLFAAALFGIGLLPQAFQRPDSAHLLWVSCISAPLALIAVYEWIGQRSPRTHPTVRLALSSATLLTAILIVCPYYTLRTYTDLAWRSVTGKTEVMQVTRGDRYFYLGDTRPYLATLAVVADLDRLSSPGQRLLVGPVDLRNTAYSDAFFYHLFPDLQPATYYIEMDPGLADRSGSRLASDVQSSDWLILTRFWSGWIEPNASVEFGSDRPNLIVEENFCLRGSYQHDLVRLYEKCATGDGIGPYDTPYQPQYDYAVEVRVPVPPRPDKTCTPTCRGEYSPEFSDIDTSIIETGQK